MASSISLICVGCGKDLSGCAKTRKKLGEDSKASDQETRASVLFTWRELTKNTESLQHCSQLEGSLLKMCNSCFNNYAKLGPALIGRPVRPWPDLFLAALMRWACPC